MQYRVVRPIVIAAGLDDAAADAAIAYAASAHDDTERARLLRYGRDLEEQAAELAIEAAAFWPRCDADRWD